MNYCRRCNMTYKMSKLEENEEQKISLDNQEISAEDFNKTLENLKPGQRILESSKNNFHVVERLQG